MMILSFLVFLSLVILGHYFAWKLVLQAFPRLVRYKGWLLAFFIVISVFFLSVFIIMRGEGGNLIHALYTISATMFGLLTQLMLLGAIYWLVFAIIKKVRSKYQEKLLDKQRLIAIITFSLAVALFILGTYNAYNPRVKTITLSGWPAELSGKSFVQLSDLHIGSVYRPAWLVRVANIVNELEPDFTVISGDLIDGSDRQLSEFVPALQSFEAPLIFTPGNHDYYVYDGEMERLVEEGDMILLSDEATVVENIEVIGFNYLARDHSDLRRDIENIREEADLPRIVLNHVPVDQAEASDLGAKLMLSGHTHRGQIFPISFMTWLMYGRFSYGLETYKEMLTYTSAGTGTWGPPLRTLGQGEIILFRFE
ncbi:hypothetical protein CVU83_00125 [Candidatus Falkowbacteria bacterium HGW-Falkowbacteria-2]|uniref:Calcineurin-like phosphoesterase domain-containing protein n=1 Tax=Candidatus Falkowbacteria bacterium HGW-Falkowbacteria-2 TaxID=2013769 RepID=A0A2N2E3W9_9BACT|nr:MAG: hypothetical protein CVU83_00125 [Candidatus Falkowbacteria bacterium HGW-Falkowbacteria-2]